MNTGSISTSCAFAKSFIYTRFMFGKVVDEAQMKASNVGLKMRQR